MRFFYQGHACNQGLVGGQGQNPGGDEHYMGSSPETPIGPNQSGQYRAERRVFFNFCSHFTDRFYHESTEVFLSQNLKNLMRHSLDLPFANCVEGWGRGSRKDLLIASAVSG